MSKLRESIKGLLEDTKSVRSGLKKIKSFNDAKDLVNAICDNYISIIIEDNEDETVSLQCITDPGFDFYVKVVYHYDGKDEGYRTDNVDKVTLAGELYDHRKTVNQNITNDIYDGDWGYFD